MEPFEMDVFSVMSGAASLVSAQLLIVGVLLILDRRRKNQLIGIFLVLYGLNSLKVTLLGETSAGWLSELIPYFTLSFFYGPLYYLYCQRIVHQKVRKNQLILHLAIAAFFFLLTLLLPFYQNYFIISLGRVANTLLVVSLFTYMLFTMKVFVTRVTLVIRRGVKWKYKLTMAIIFSQMTLSAVIVVLYNYLSEKAVLSLYPYSYYINEGIFILTSSTVSVILITEISWIKNLVTPEKIRIDKKCQDSHSLDRIMSELRDRELYRDPDFNIHQLSGSIDISPPRISKLVTDSLSISFRDLIVQMKIAEFKKQVMLDNDSKYDLVSIALESGFRSKATFYRNFKKWEGITPNEFVKQIRNDQ